MRTGCIFKNMKSMGIGINRQNVLKNENRCQKTFKIEIEIEIWPHLNPITLLSYWLESPLYFQYFFLSF